MNRIKKLSNRISIEKLLFNNGLNPNRALPDNMRIDHVWSKTLFEQLDRYFVNKHSRYSFIHIAIVLICLTRLGENVTFLIIDASDYIRYVLNDWSLFVGGLQTYQLFTYCSAFFWITVLHFILYLPLNEETMVWRHLFDMCRGTVCPARLGMTANDCLLVKKFVNRADLMFKLSSYSFYNLCKYCKKLRYHRGMACIVS